MYKREREREEREREQIQLVKGVVVMLLPRSKDLESMLTSDTGTCIPDAIQYMPTYSMCPYQELSCNTGRRVHTSCV